MSKLGPHFIGAPGLERWIEAKPRVFKFDPTGLGASSQVDAGPLVVGKLDQQDNAIGLTDWKALMNRGATPAAAADLRFNAQRTIFVGPNKPLLDRYLANPRIDVWEDDNEVVPDNAAEAEWYVAYCVEMMKRYETIGKRRANFSFAVGTPAMSIWTHLLPAVRYARDNGHYIALHEYMGYEADYGVGWRQVDASRNPIRLWHGRTGPGGQPDESYPYGWAALRYRYIYDTVLAPAGLGDVKLLITELGCDSVESVTPAGKPVGSWRAMGLGEQAYADMLAWYDRMIGQDSYVTGATVFTVGSVGVWRNWDIAGTAVERRLLEHIKASPDVVPLPPPDVPLPPPVITPANILANGGFEGGWYHPVENRQPVMELQLPARWTLKWRGKAWSNPFDPAIHAQFVRPEIRTLPKSQLPPAEQSVFIRDGEYCLKAFKGNGSWYATFAQKVEIPRGRWRLSLPVWPDLVARYENGKKVFAYNNPNAGLMRVRIGAGKAITGDTTTGPFGGGWVSLTPGRWNIEPVEFDVTADGEHEIKIDFMLPYPLPQNGIFADEWTLTKVAVTPPPPDPEPAKPAKIIDISKWQGSVNPAKMKAAGVDGVMVRATYGTYVDEKVHEFAPALLAAGIPIGFYHYFHPFEDPDKQFAAFRGVVVRYGYQLRLALDLEEPSGVDAGLPARARLFAEAMRREFSMSGGRKHLIYTNASYWRTALKSPVWGADYELWIAAWTNAAKPSVPAPWTTWTVWQYTSEGNGPAHGVGSARVDINRFNGDRTAWLAWQTTSAEPQPEPGLPAATLWEMGQKTKVIRRNPLAALEVEMAKAGYAPVGNESRAVIGGVEYALQIAASASNNERLYYVVAQQWPTIDFLIGPEPSAPPAKPPPPTPATIDLLPYLRGRNRTQFDMGYDGGTQTTQVFHIGANDWLYIKGENGEYERLGVRTWQNQEWIFRFEDTSESATRFYAHYLVEGGRIGAPWIPRRVMPGLWYTTTKFVRHYLKAGCIPQNGGNVVDKIRLLAGPRPVTYPQSGQTVQDVVTLEWSAGEQYDFAGGNIAFRDKTRSFWFIGWLTGRADKVFKKPTCLDLGW